MDLILRGVFASSWSDFRAIARQWRVVLSVALPLIGATEAALAQPKPKPTAAAAAAVMPNSNARAVDSLRRIVAAHPHDTLGASALVTLEFNYLYNDTAQAGQYGRRALRLATVLGDHRRLARSSYNLATLAGMSSDPDKSVRLHLFSAQQFLLLGNSLWAGHNYANAARRRISEGRFAEAMRLSLQGLRLRQAAHDTAAVADSYGIIGQIYLEQQNLPAAQVAYEQSLRGWRQKHVPMYVIESLDHLAIIHRDAGRYDRARAYVGEGLAEARAQPDSTQSHGLLLTLAVLEQRLGRWAAALPLLRRIEAGYGREPAGRITPAMRADLYSILGESLVRTGQPALAAPYLTQALAMARASHNRQEEIDALEGLADLSAARADFRGAFAYRQTVESLKDTLRLATTTRTVAELQTQYETERKEADNRLQAAQLLAQQQIIRRRNAQLLAGGALLLLLGGAGYAAFAHRRRRREAEFGTERQRLLHQRTAAVLEAEETERRRIGADLHDGVGQLLTATRLNLAVLSRDLDVSTSATQHLLLDNALSMLDESFREVRSISHDLMPNALIKNGLAVAVRDFLSKLAANGGLRAEVQLFGLEERLPPLIESVLFRAIQELAQNVIKHAQASEMILQIVCGADELTVMVEDNGVGFDPAALRPDAGIGLHNVETRLAYLGGQAHFDGAPGRGTVVTLTVPLASPRPAA